MLAQVLTACSQLAAAKNQNAPAALRVQVPFVRPLATMRGSTILQHLAYAQISCVRLLSCAECQVKQMRCICGKVVRKSTHIRHAFLSQYSAKHLSQSVKAFKEKDTLLCQNIDQRLGGTVARHAAVFKGQLQPVEICSVICYSLQTWTVSIAFTIRKCTSLLAELTTCTQI